MKLYRQLFNSVECPSGIHNPYRYPTLVLILLPQKRFILPRESKNLIQRWYFKGRDDVQKSKLKAALCFCSCLFKTWSVCILHVSQSLFWQYCMWLWIAWSPYILCIDSLLLIDEENIYSLACLMLAWQNWFSSEDYHIVFSDAKNNQRSIQLKKLLS